MGNVTFTDNTVKVLSAMDDAAIAFLVESTGEMVSQATRNSRVDTGQTKGSWDSVIDESSLGGTVGSNLENAIWEEFGTGEYALEGNGRKGGWVYISPKTGKRVFTLGKKPNRALWKAFQVTKARIVTMAESKFKELDG